MKEGEADNLDPVLMRELEPRRVPDTSANGIMVRTVGCFGFVVLVASLGAFVWYLIALMQAG